ncbi:MAG: PfkB family carbohydrate kinase [Myxococcota bacterium]
MKPGFDARFRRKLKTAKEVRRLVGPMPRQRKVIMCHGTFDVVHPGHIRHLLYAGSKADILVASLTTDAHIAKGDLRPYVPEELRAMNLAALELVDYVIIDPNPTPLENLRTIQPDYFAKGYEYASNGIHLKTREEIEVIESYGGEILFTPGDVVYSSSRLLNEAPPNLSAEKLRTLLDAEGLGFRDLRVAFETFAGARIHVVGDSIVDTYTYCSLIGSNGKTPTFSVRYEKQTEFAGGAAVVAKHLSAAGAQVTLSTVLGRDELGRFVVKDLEKAAVQCRAIIDPTRPTTKKNVICAGSYRLLKIDTLDNRTISDKILEQLRGQIACVPCDAIIFSDFRHGIFDRRTTPTLSAAIPEGCFRVADSQVASRWGNILDFRGFDLITPNEKEARFALGDQDSVVRPLALALYKRASCRTLMLKLGPRGVLIYRRPVGDVRAFFAIDSFAEGVTDATGSGDAFLAYATLGQLGTGRELLAGALGSFAAAVACERDGNVPVAPSEVMGKLIHVERSTDFDAAPEEVGP